MSDNARYWIWLQKALGEGFSVSRIIECYDGIVDFYNANIIDWKVNLYFTEKQIDRLEKTTLDDAQRTIDVCSDNGWQIIDYDDERYPERLKNIYNPPAVLYADGELPDIDNLVVIGIVGTRKASEYSLRVAKLMSRGIAEAGAAVVSGGALGVDTAAHRGALDAGGKTVAVLGCGLGSNYLSANKSLREEICKSGCLITEYPPFKPADRTTFPLRNRIISGISLGVLVVEAGVKSGSLITANFALEQGRDVYAVPASVLSVDYAGTNRLIADGAKVVTAPEHLIEAYAPMYGTVNMSEIRSIEALMNDYDDNSANISRNNDKYSFDNIEQGRERQSRRQQAELKLSGDLKSVYDCLDEKAEHIDVITDKSKMGSAKVLSALTQLEIMGLAESASGKRYKKS